MKNVLIIMSTNIFSGAEKVLVDYLKNNNAYHFFIYTNAMEMPLLDKVAKLSSNITLIKKQSMRVISIRRNTFSSIAHIAYNLYCIHKIVKRYNINLIYGNNTIDMLYVMLYKYLSKSHVGAICHVHDIIQRNMYHKLIKRFSPLVNAFIVPSQSGKDSFQRDVDTMDKIHVIHNGCNIEYSPDFIDPPIRNNKKKLILVGQICKRKRVDLFIEIIRHLQFIKPNKFEGVIVGPFIDEEGDYSKKIKAMLKKMNRCIHFKGLVQSKTLLQTSYLHADALILTSDRDPLPTVILEAMALGVPVIARRVDGVAEMIEDKVTGFSWPYDATVDEISSYIDEVFSKSYDLEKIRFNAKKKLKTEFSLEWKKNRINSLIDSFI